MSSSLLNDSFESKVTLSNDSIPLPENMPFHLLMMGDWGGSAAFSSKPLAERKFVEVDRDVFEDVIRKITPELILNFDGNVSLKLTFESLDDFHPDNIFERVSLFSDLRKIRQNLKGTDTFDKAASEVRSWFEDSSEVNEFSNEVSKSSPVSVRTDDLLDQILDNKQESFSDERISTRSPLSEFVGRIVAPHRVKVDTQEQSKLLAIVDEVASDLMRKILHHQDFQNLESAWRGLFFLVRRVETDSNLKIFIIQASHSELLDNLSSVNGLDGSEVYRWMVGDDSIDEYSPWAAVFGNYKFSSNVEDTAALIRIAKIAAVARSPFISQFSSEIFGFNSFDQMSGDDNWKVSPQTSEYKLWSALRSLPESGYLGLSFPRFIGRLPYGEQTDPAEKFTFEEFKSEPKHSDYVWLNPCFAYAYALSGQYSLNEWAIDSNSATSLENLPLHIYKFEGSTFANSCAEIDMSENIYNAIIDQGIMTLIPFKGEDRIRLSALRSISLESNKLKGKWSS